MGKLKLPFKAKHNCSGKQKERKRMKSALKKEFRALLEEADRENEENMFEEFNEVLEEYERLTRCPFPDHCCFGCKYIGVCDI